MAPHHASRIALSVRRAVRPEVRRELVRRLGRAMQAARVAHRELSLSLVGDREMRKLNREYAEEDHATDVLSFEQEGSLLGDIVISVDTALRQARGKRPLIEELFHLAVHGLAHLCGYDHATPDEERVMFAWEAKLRARSR